MPTLLNENVPSWRDETAVSRYPFEDDATLVATDDRTVSVPNGLIVDAALYPTFDPVGLYRIRVTEDGEVTLVFASDSGATTAEATFTPGQNLADVYESDRVAGVLVLGDEWEKYTAGWKAGVRRFDQRRNLLVPSAVQSVSTAGIEGITDGLLTAAGELWLIGENGVAVRPMSDTEVRIDVTGDPLFRRRKCEPTDAFVTPSFVKTINGQPPDDYGQFLVTTGDAHSVLRILPADGGLKVDVAGRRS